MSEPVGVACLFKQVAEQTATRPGDPYAPDMADHIPGLAHALHATSTGS